MDAILILVVLVVLIIVEIVWFFHRYQTAEERDEHQTKLIWGIVITIVMVLVVAKLVSSGSNHEYGVVAGTTVTHYHGKRSSAERPAPVPLYYDQICYGKDPCAPGQIHRAEWERSRDKADNPAYTHPDIADALGGASKVKHAQRRKWLPFGKKR